MCQLTQYHSMRKKDTDTEARRLAKIVSILQRTPGGLWVRELARQAGLHSETTRRIVISHPKIFTEYADFTKYGIKLKIVKLKK
ncbi:MAG: hypothetical protein KAJ91_00950 [Candidatus Aenigmarchaeota archaeon]|nr:hypothetical protein [Candidatus Aenigmarchaeota archaeon]